MLMKKKFNLRQIILIVFAFITLRVLFEWVLLDYPTELITLHDYFIFYMENLYYFIFVFLLVSFSISKIIKRDLIETMNYNIRIVPLIVLPPLIDSLLLGITEGYFYATAKNFLYNFLTMSLLKGDASVGITIEVVLIFLIVFAYVCYIRKSPLIALLAGYITSLIIVIVSTPSFFFGAIAISLPDDYFISLYYIFPVLFFCIFLFYNYNKKKLKAVLSNMRLLKSSMFVLFALLGSIAAKKLGYNFDIYRTFLASMITFFGWQFSIVINDVHDIGIDIISNKSRPLVKKILTEKEYLFVGWAFAFFALSLAAILNIKIFILTIIALFFGVVYSSPPLRLRNNLLGNLVMGISLIITFMIGLLVADNSNLLINKINLIYFTLLFIFAAVVTLAKDIKDIKSDSKHGVKNIYTIFGRERGKKLITILLFLVMVTPLIYIRNNSILFISILSGLINCYWYYKKEDERIAYLIGALLLIYVFFILYSN